MLRRSAPSRLPVLRVGDLELNTVTRAMHRGSRAISLTAKEYALMEYLMRNAGQVLTLGQIYGHVWDYQSGLDSNLVPVYIGYLRESRFVAKTSNTSSAASAMCSGMEKM